MPVRPRLRTSHRVVARPDGTLQLGLGEDALLLTGLPAGLAAAVRALDGRSTLDQLECRCAGDGVRPEALRRLLAALADAGAVDAGPPAAGHQTVPLGLVDALAGHGLGTSQAQAGLGRLARCTVAIVGRGTLPESLTGALTGLVGAVEQVDTGTVPRADVLVLVARDAVEPVAAGHAVLSGRPVLPVVAGHRSVAVGPWHAGASTPCPECLDLRRADADDAWPAVLAQLSRPGRDGRAPRADADPVAAALAGAVVAQWVRRRVLGLPETPGLTCELDAWDLGMTHRVWPVHPRCTHHERAAASEASAARRAG